MLEARGRARAPRPPPAGRPRCSTYAPIGTISPVCSAIGMNADGADEPALRVLPAQQRLGADDAAARAARPAAGRRRAARRARARAGARPRGRAARRRARASTRRRPRSAPCRAPWRGTSRRRRRAAAPRDRPTPALALRTPKLAVTNRWRPSSSTGARSALASRSATRRAADLAADGDRDRELVAAEARDQVAGAQHAPHALGDDLEQVVAGAVAERVVDHLEVVEVDEQHRDLVAAGSAISSRSRCRNSVRFGSPVSGSWCAW